MAQSALVTKWKFVVEFEDDETKELSATIGQANTREECQSLIEHDIQYHRSHERTVTQTEAVEICAQCEGDGKISAGNGRQVICEACGGHHGPISKSTSSRATTVKINGQLLGHFPGLGRSAVHLRPVEPELFH
jgi:DnaJ-class molecular chaperone